jgi:hypothetical protein
MKKILPQILMMHEAKQEKQGTRFLMDDVSQRVGYV